MLLTVKIINLLHIAPSCTIPGGRQTSSPGWQFCSVNFVWPARSESDFLLTGAPRYMDFEILKNFDWPFSPPNDLWPQWKKNLIYTDKMHCSSFNLKILHCLVVEIKFFEVIHQVTLIHSVPFLARPLPCPFSLFGPIIFKVRVWSKFFEYIWFSWYSVTVKPDPMVY